MEEKTVTEIVDLVRQLDDMVKEEGWERRENISLVKKIGKYSARLLISENWEEEND